VTVAALTIGAAQTWPQEVSPAAVAPMVGTIERCVVLGELLEARSALTSAQLARRLRAHNRPVDAALSALEEYGQVRRLLPVDGGAAMFVIEDQCERAYVRCPGCGAVEALANHPFDSICRRLHGRFGLESRFADSYSRRSASGAQMRANRLI
jgi:Fe2+ or Zn2+ uptake regulation protein